MKNDSNKTPDAWQIIGIIIIVLFIFGVAKEIYLSNVSKKNDQKEKLVQLKNKSNEPDILLSYAKRYINSKDFDYAKNELQNLIENYPTSQEAKEAKNLISILEDSIKIKKLAGN